MESSGRPIPSFLTLPPPLAAHTLTAGDLGRIPPFVPPSAGRNPDRWGEDREAGTSWTAEGWVVGDCCPAQGPVFGR